METPQTSAEAKKRDWIDRIDDWCDRKIKPIHLAMFAAVFHILINPIVNGGRTRIPMSQDNKPSTQLMNKFPEAADPVQKRSMPEARQALGAGQKD